MHKKYWDLCCCCVASVVGTHTDTDALCLLCFIIKYVYAQNIGTYATVLFVW